MILWKENSTTIDPDDNASWDFVYEVNGSNPVSLGIYEGLASPLTLNKTYYYRAYAENLGGSAWSPTIENFRAIDTRFTEETMEGLVLWLDALDVDGDNKPDSVLDDSLLPLWVDKSKSDKNALQTVALQSPSYAENAFGSLPGVRFQTGNSYNLGSLSLNYGNVHVFMVTQGSGVGVGATDGLSSWTLDAKPGNRLGIYKSENNTLQNITLGLDPSTGFGQLIGEIAEIMIFDRNLQPIEKEKIEGYLAHKWGVIDDLTQSGFKVRNELVLYYPFNETDGSIVQDYSTSLRDATVVDAALDTVGKFGSGILFSPDMEQTKILLPEGNHLSWNNKNWTISTWFSAPLPIAGVEDLHALFNEYLEPYVAFNYDQKTLTLFDGSSFSDTNFVFNNATGWHHLVIKSSPSSMQFYMDGNNVDSFNKGIVLNIESIGNLFAGNGLFAEKMDDFRIYSKGLSITEITDLYGNGDGDFGVHPYEEFPPEFDNIPEVIIPESPVVYWTFNELNGTEVRDDSGLENHGYVENNTSTPDLFFHSEPGRNGSAIRFDGGETIVLEQDVTTFNVSGPFSLCIWLKSADLNAQVINSGRFAINVSDGFLWGQVQVGGVIKQTESIPLPAEEWFHLILLWDGNKLRLYKNNEEVTSPINSSGNLTGSGTLYFGGRPGINEPYEGLMDDLRIFDQALTAGQRQEVYNFSDPALIAYYGEDFSYNIESLKGPTDFNATGLPSGLEIDTSSGLIFGEANETGIFPVEITVSNISGSDSKTFELQVSKGRQSILQNEDVISLTYGDLPADLNITATSGLPVEFSITEGNETIDLNGSRITVKQTGFASIRASQPGDDNWLPAESVLLNYQVMAKEVLITTDDQFRKTVEVNPVFTFYAEGLTGSDLIDDFNLTILPPVENGSVSSPTPPGSYPIITSGITAENYIFAYQYGTLVVSDKSQQQIVFDQDLSLVSAVTPFINLEGHSQDMEGNITSLPLSFTVEDASIARILETQKNVMTAYWKFDENLYNGAKDEINAYNGSLLNLVTTGIEKVWVPGRFHNSIQMGQPSNGMVNFGSVELDHNFSISFWLKPENIMGPASTLLSKNNINSMKVFKLEKGEENASLRLSLYLDGVNEELVFSSTDDLLEENIWSHITITYNDSNGSVQLFKNGQLNRQISGKFFTGTSIISRFSSMKLGDEINSFTGLFDDLRVYKITLDDADMANIYGSGFGDFTKIEIIGAGQTKITAMQLGDSQYEASLPFENYLTVYKVPQEISFASIKNHSVGDFPFPLTAASDSGLPVNFSSSNPAVATPVGNYLYVHGAGEVTIYASQEGNEKYDAAIDKNQSFTVNYGNLFTDSAPGLKLWFDATDVNADSQPDEVIDFIAQNKISMWADKSGNNNNPIQGNLLSMPLWTPEALNAKPTVTFDSNLSFLLQDPVSDSSFVFLVHKQETVGLSSILGGDLGTTSADGYVALAHASGNVEILSESPSTEWSVSTLRVLPNAQSLWVNGAIVGTDSYNQGADAFNLVGNNFIGEIAEVLVFEEELNKVTREKVEGYLAHKWGLDSKLLPSHPYYSVAPTFGGSQEIIWGGVVTYEEAGKTKSKLPIKALGDLPFRLQAYATSGLPVSFVSSNTSVVAITGDIASIVGVGEVTITAIQMGDSRYHPAAPSFQDLHVIAPVTKDDQGISFSEISLKVRDDPPFLIEALATSSGINHPVFHLPLNYEVKSGPATIDSNGLVALDGIAGNVVISLSQSGSAYVNPALPVDVVFEVSSKQRPSVLFKNLAGDGNLTDIPTGYRPLVLQGVSTDNGKPFIVTSSNTSIVSIHNGSQIIPLAPGIVSLSFVIPESDSYLVSEITTKTLRIVAPTKEAWVAFRKSDVRYDKILERFTQRYQSLNSSLSLFDATEKARKIFNENYADSDEDGYSNLFERASGSDSLGPDKRHHLPQQILLPDNKQRISFVRYKSPLQTTGEAFEYHVEQSTNLQTWDSSGLMEESIIDLSQNMERVTVVTTESIQSGQRRFLRLRISIP